MISEKSRVCQYLALVKNYANSEFVLSPRSKNYEFLFAWGLSLDDVKGVVMALQAKDYIEGPCKDDKDLGRSDVWIFGKTVQIESSTVDVYIKVTISKAENGLGCLCISFHESEYPLHYAFGGEQREAYLLP